jgi:hypothetical protein
MLSLFATPNPMPPAAESATAPYRKACCGKRWQLSRECRQRNHGETVFRYSGKIIGK